MNQINGLLSKYNTVRAYTPISHATVMWRYHVARMDIFSDSDAVSLKALRTKLTSLEVPSLLDFQEEVQREIRRTCGVYPPTANKRLSSAAESVGASGEERPTKQLRQQQPQQEPKFMYPWSDEIGMARKAIAPAVLTAALLCPESTSAASLLGPEITASFKGKPCKHLLLMGKCRYGNKCKFEHSPTSAPSEEIIAGVKTRLASRAKELEAQAKN